ncbi:MAG: NAD(P)H-dependent oxidoreductase [Elusimicrobiaceae bacterium]|nr:NAD(P)H-dependent oxidoreductase [Elusimicrobiaceae bacterium]
MKKSLVAYFSASGITGQLAKRLAQTIGADTFEIIPQVLYTQADLDWTDKQSRSTLEMQDKNCRPPLAHPVPDMSKYDVVFVGFPVWWYREPSIVDTFMESCHWKNQIVIPFATSGGSGLGDASQNMQALVPQVVVKDGKLWDVQADSLELASWAREYL